MKKLIAKFKAETPVFARVLQSLSTAIAAIPLYYSSLPADFQANIPKNIIWYICIGGAVVTFLLNLFTPKSNV